MDNIYLFKSSDASGSSTPTPPPTPPPTRKSPTPPPTRKSPTPSPTKSPSPTKPPNPTPPPSAGPGPGPGPNPKCPQTPTTPPGTNYEGVAGDCKTMGAGKASGQCNSGQMGTCPQKYPFPYYYYDMYATRSMKQSNIKVEDLPEKTKTYATNICNKAEPATWESIVKSGKGDSTVVLWDQIAQIFKANNPEHVCDCWAAIIIATGECQPDTNYKGCTLPQSVWQNGSNLDSPDLSAKELYAAPSPSTPNSQPISSICGADKSKNSTIPPSNKSGGNSNYIGPFCHINVYGGPGWGGGMCCCGTGNV